MWCVLLSFAHADASPVCQSCFGTVEADWEGILAKATSSANSSLVDSHCTCLTFMSLCTNTTLILSSKLWVPSPAVVFN